MILPRSLKNSQKEKWRINLVRAKEDKKEEEEPSQVDLTLVLELERRDEAGSLQGRVYSDSRIAR